MTRTAKFLLLAGVLALSACSTANDFRGDNVVDLNNPDGFNDGSLEGDFAGGPGSITFFQERIGDRVLFAVDSSDISGQGRLILDGQARWLGENPDYTGVIEGHADEQGTREYNLALGARRANTIRDYLVGKGVSPTRLKVVSFGKERPIEICSSESCYSQNRRAVTVLAAGLSG